MTGSPDQDFVLKTIKSRDVHFVRFWFCDVLGRMKSFAVIPSELENAFEEGMGFDGSCVQGFSMESESDMLAYPKHQPSRFYRGALSVTQLHACFAQYVHPRENRLKAIPVMCLSVLQLVLSRWVTL